MINLTGRKVKMFRCQVDPMVGPKPRNAFMPATMAMEAELTDKGVYVKVLPHGTFQGTEHLIPFANIQSIGLEPDPNQCETEVIPLKRGPGRPQGS